MSIIETVSGKMINIANPSPDDILLNDFAWAISRVSRFAGHTISEVPLNVAQHSVYVCDMILKNENRPDVEEIALFGLLHDCGEAYLGDIPSPVKHMPGLIDAFDAIENNFLNIIFEKYVGALPTPEQWDVVKKYDKKALRIEAYHFMVSRGQGWTGDTEPLDLIELQTYPKPSSSILAYEKFLHKYETLSSLISKT
jgi:hypothetical protein